MWQLQQESSIAFQYNFFASGHGKSLCDAHIGVSKQRVRSVAKAGANIDTVEQLRTILLTLKNTTAINLESINRSQQYDVLPFDNGVKHYHQFTFDTGPIINCRKLSNVGEYVHEMLCSIDDVIESIHETCDTTDTQFTLDLLSQLTLDVGYEEYDGEFTICENEFESLLDSTQISHSIIYSTTNEAEIYCNCKTGCESKRCICKKNNHYCTQRCHTKCLTGTACANA